MPTTETTMRPTRWACARIAVLLAGALLGGCASFVPQPGPPPEPAGHYVDLTTPFIAVGDSQEHEATGFPLHDNDSAVDAYVEVAQRPPEQPLFGRRILEWALQSHPGEPFVHLGDVMDMSCRSEAQRIRKAFDAGGTHGAILPGNHDGLMFGIYGYNVLDVVLDAEAQKWNQACRRGARTEDRTRKTGNEALSKRDFIALYLAGQLAGIPKPGLQAPPAVGAHRIRWRHPDPQAFLSAIEGQVVDGAGYADSFIAQRLRLPKAPGAPREVIVIGLDTNQAGAFVSSWDTLMGRSPGSTGHVHRDQVRAVTPWVLEAARNGDIVVFAGHHNWRSLGLPTRLLLRDLMSNLAHPLVYLSAHTHSGFWAVHREIDRRPLLEMNVSSLSDWPIAYRRIHFAWDERAERLLVRADLMPRGEQPVASYADLLAAWEAQTCRRQQLSGDLIRQTDGELVRRQRAARGSVLEWLLRGIGPACEGCDQTLYEHAQAYQDAQLDVLVQTGRHLLVTPQLQFELSELQRREAPSWCQGADFETCIAALKAQKPTDYGAHVTLFRRKAEMVDLLGNHLDDLTHPEAKAYMTCRAVQAAQIDFEATAEERNEHRSEAKRSAEQFFRIEASVGMD
jgi:hypothetical protein